jgi:hypothetical protein
LENSSKKEFKLGMDNRLDIGELLANDNIDDAVVQIIRELPSYLYKIYPPDPCRIDSIVSDEIWFSSPNLFDDPFDTGYWINNSMTIQNLLKESGISIDQLKDPALMSQFLISQVELMRKKIQSHYAICCFTENINSTVLWSQYGKTHEGFAVQYNIKDIKSVINLSYFIFPVKYSSQTIDFETVFITNPKTWEYLLCLIKSSEWDYQKEWRGILKTADDSNNGKGQLQKCPKVEAIYLGLRSDKILRDKLLCVAQNKNIYLYEMSVLSNILEIIPRPIFIPT